MICLVKLDESNNVFFICLIFYDSKRYKKNNWKGVVCVIVKSNILMLLFMVCELLECVIVGKYVVFFIFLYK